MQYGKGGFDVRDEEDAKPFTQVLLFILQRARGVLARDREEMALNAVQYVLDFKLRLSGNQTECLSTLLEASERREFIAHRNKFIRITRRESNGSSSGTYEQHKGDAKARSRD